MLSLFNFWIRSNLVIITFFFEKMLRIKHCFIRWRLIRDWDKSKTNMEVTGYEGQKASLESAFQSMGEDRRWAMTSGTRAEPKKIPYDLKRLNKIRQSYLESMIVLTQKYFGFKTFFVFSSLEKDQSLTAGLVSEDKKLNYFIKLQAPYRYLSSPDAVRLRASFSTITIRLALIIISRPRFVYATNPSTLVNFIEEIDKNWDSISLELLKLSQLKPEMDQLLAMSDGDGRGRFELLLQLKQPPKPEFVFEKTKAFITWTGGYVYPFIERLNDYIKKPIIPMFSMSTETLETLPHIIDGEIVYGPFMPETRPLFYKNDPLNLLSANELQSGEIYNLVVSNKYGLQNYDTGDQFKVKRIVGSWPDLEFIRRREMTASLTGEKITESQVLLLYSKLKTEFSELKTAFLSIYPSIAEDQFCYVMLVIGAEANEDIGRKAQKELELINQEYSDKVRSGRLGSLKIKSSSLQELASLMGQANNWESQFKVLPLYERPL